MHLKTELARLLGQAESAPGHKQTYRHTNNLKIDILVQDGQAYVRDIPVGQTRIDRCGSFFQEKVYDLTLIVLHNPV